MLIGKKKDSEDIKANRFFQMQTCTKARRRKKEASTEITEEEKFWNQLCPKLETRVDAKKKAPVNQIKLELNKLSQGVQQREWQLSLEKLLTAASSDRCVETLSCKDSEDTYLAKLKSNAGDRKDKVQAPFKLLDELRFDSVQDDKKRQGYLFDKLISVGNSDLFKQIVAEANQDEEK